MEHIPMHTPRIRPAILLSAAALGLAFCISYLGSATYIANQALQAEVHPLKTTPGAYDIPYENVSFHPRNWEDITLRGWWIPASSPQGTIVWQHGLDANRERHLPLLLDLHERGFSILAADLRGHGESDKAAMGAGLFEVDDVLGAVDFLIETKGIEPGTIGLMGDSYGAAIVLMAAPQEPAVAGVVADSSFSRITDLIVQEIVYRTPLPEWGVGTLMPGLLLVGGTLYGVDLAAIAPEEAIAQLPYPVLLIHGDTDTRIPVMHGKRLAEFAPEGSKLIIVPDAGHSETYETFGTPYTDHVEAYFRERFDKQSR